MTTIMIIDDDVEWAGNLSVFFVAAGYAVTTLNDVEGALEKLREDKPDLLILDVMFPENPVAGLDLARTIRRVPEFKGLPIIMLTGVNESSPMDFYTGDPKDDCRPIQDFIDKPVELKELLGRVRQALNLPAQA